MAIESSSGEAVRENSASPYVANATACAACSGPGASVNESGVNANQGWLPGLQWALVILIVLYMFRIATKWLSHIKGVARVSGNQACGNHSAHCADAHELAKIEAIANERIRLAAIMQLRLLLPLTAIAKLQHASQIQFAALILEQIVRDLCDPSLSHAHSVVLDEIATNPRWLIETVAALLTPCATQNGVRLCTRIDSLVGTPVLADGARFGQILFYTLLHAIQTPTHDEVTLVARAQRLNRGTQRITVEIVRSGSESALPHSNSTTTGSTRSLCQMLTRRMRGELTIAMEPGAMLRARFTAPFTIVDGESATGSCDFQSTLPDRCTPNAHTVSASVPENEASEPFESRYFDALQEEGIDLQKFHIDWRNAMNNDLERLADLHRRGDVDHLSSLLHRLSGAVGLVGARDLTEALRGASISPQRECADQIATLMKRARTLMAQLDARCVERSTSR